jgi:hypothetical protein
VTRLRRVPIRQPAEGIWSSLKRSLANLTKHGIGEPVMLVKPRLKRMRYRPGLLDACLAKTGLDLSNSHH